ncbi:aryl-alcohol oxidase-like protein [Dendrothele bispora CBS 962.96]|uniref:Aryl-alcohol oxidase-like protein n=1 Tax=Dendrothele bispora (strain CBS 962.96) TaxID=1314807 RepID=A0A4S8MEG0_DENBC|nr:aryl-alcohol oxidase-like protein [Dendrothele bispora CBS 962.96]
MTAPLTLLILFLLAARTYAKVFYAPQELAQYRYDFIIVGAGTAGNVLANRLSEDPQVSVLVVEAGISNRDNLDIVVPFLGVAAPGTSVDWNFTTLPQEGLNNRSIHFARGFVLGGSSSINLLTWNRGSNDLWDRWSELTDDEEWAWPSIEPYYLKTSHLVPPADDTSGEVKPSTHGFGPVEVSISGFPTELDDRVLETSHLIGGRFSFTKDLNTGKTLGFSHLQSSIGNGTRSSSATAYLDPVLYRDNLDVLVSTRATKLITDSTNAGIPIFRTLEIAQSSNGARYNITAAKEILLCGGVVGTPHLLLLSGIGPKNEIESLGIPSIVDLPDVGKHLADHPLLPNYFSVNSSNTFDEVLRNSSLFNETLDEWMASGQGLFVDPPANTIGFMRLPEDSIAFNHQPNPASGPLSANTEFLFVDGFAALGALQQPAIGNFLTVLTALVSPTSRGSITLQSIDPFTDPLIDPALLTTEFDVLAMVQTMKDVEVFISAQPWTNFIISPFGDLANATTDTARISFIRNNSVTVNHPVGTARMSPKHTSWGVTDSNLLVKHTEGLRIVDASIFPQIPECHPQALVYTVAERAVDLIKQAHGVGITLPLVH